MIRADVIEAIEFPELSARYKVYSVPKIVINESVQFEGAYPEKLFVDKVIEAAK